jgi:hypothetical protein
MGLPSALAGTRPVCSRCFQVKFTEREFMDSSVGQARWLLAPIFGVAITVIVIGLALG